MDSERYRMKKDIFNGKISTECIGLVKFSLIFATAIFILLGAIFLWVALCYENVERAGRIFLYCLSSVTIVGGISFPFIMLHLIKIYPKRRKITNKILQEWVFREYDDSVEKNFYKD